MVQVITDANFEVETQEGVVLVDFWAPWCGPCRMQAPILEQLADEVDEDELRIYKMDVDENPNTARQFGIMSIPTLCSKRWTGCETSCWCPHERSNQSYLGRDWLIENESKWWIDYLLFYNQTYFCDYFLI